MELPGSAYLYNLTLISVTFAGFTALLAALRQMNGGRLRKHDIFLIGSALVRSLIVIVCALLPPLLALFELSASRIWRISSFVAAILIALFCASWPLVRRAGTNRPMATVSRAYFAAQWATAAFLLMAALAIFFEPTPGHFAAGISVFMLVSWVSVLWSLEIMTHEDGKRGRR